jgi:hypothetical protein
MHGQPNKKKELRNVCFKFHETWTNFSEVSLEGTQTDIMHTIRAGYVLE